jgi:outer membrane protein assembly factor BamB
MLAGCAGGTSGRSAPVVPQAATAASAALGNGSRRIGTPTSTKTTRVEIRLSNAKRQPVRRRPRYISPSTRGIGVSAYPSGSTPPVPDQAFFDASPSSSTCRANSDGSRTCIFYITAPVGVDDFKVDLYDASPAGETDTGNLLGTGYALSQTIVAGSPNPLNLVIDGVVASLKLAPSSVVAIGNGTTQTFTAGVSLLDADSNVIIGTDPLATPVALSITGDPDRTLSLSTTSIDSGAAAGFTLTYNGGPLVNATLTASAGTNITSSIPVQAFEISPPALSFTATTPQTVTVSDAGYGGVVQALTSDPTCATVSPASATPASAGAPVSFTVTPVTTSSCTVTIVGRVGASIPVSVSLPGITLPGRQHWLILPRSETLSVTEAGFKGAFQSSVSGSGCVTPSPSTVVTTNGTAAFTITAAAQGTCTVTLTGNSPHAFAYTVYDDTWTTFAHDQLRTGYQSDPAVTLSKSSVSQLQLRWSTWLGASVPASPLVANGRIYVVSYNGPVESIDAKTGSTIWKITPFGSTGSITMTPVLDNGSLFVGQHAPEGSAVSFDSINAETGAINWSISLPGAIRADPAVVNGTVYVGTADGDPPPDGSCFQGGVYAINEATGAIVWHYVVDQTASDGGSVWSPITYDGSKLIFGTGNTCSGTAPLDDAANSVVALSPQTGAVVWVSNILERQTNDNDDGAGGALWNGAYYSMSKNGNFYIINPATGAVGAKIPLGIAGWGGNATPATDGSTVVVSSGYRQAPSATVKTGEDGGFVYGFDLSGNRKWLDATSQQPVFGATLVNGIVFAGMDAKINALDENSGAPLWTFALNDANDYAYAPPVVTQSGLYVATVDGFLYAFGTNSVNSSAHATIRRPFALHRIKAFVQPNVLRALHRF